MSTLEEGAKFGTKLLETLDKFTSPWNKRRQNKADMEADQKKLDMIRNNPDMDIVYVNGEMSARRRDPVALAERAQQRELADSIRQQENLEDILDLASGEGEAEETVSDKPVDEDWITRFFSIAKDVNSEEMKIIWAKILAGEIKQPGSFSLRTMEMLRSISKREAEEFQRVAQFILLSRGVGYIPREDEMLKKYQVYYGTILDLDDCGLINSGSTIGFVRKKEDTPFYAGNSERIIFVEVRKEIEGNITIPAYTLTRAGNELFSVLKPAGNAEFIQEYAQILAEKKKYKVTVHEVESVLNDGNMRYNRNPVIAYGEIEA